MVLRTRTYGILLVSASDKLNDVILSSLNISEYNPVDIAASISKACRMFAEKDYDIVIINAPMPDEFGTRLAIDVCDDSQASSLLLVSSDIYDEIYDKVADYGVVVLSKPTSMQIVSQSLRILCAVRERIRKLNQKQASVEEKISQMRIISHAKWLLIEHDGMTEDEAHKYIEHSAMDKRKSKAEIANMIIKKYES